MLFKNFIELKRGFDLPTQNRKSGKYPVVSSNGISDYHSDYKCVAPGVITGRSGTIGNTFYINDNYWPLNTTLYVIDFKNNIPKYVYYTLCQFNFIDYATGTSVPTLNRNFLDDVEIKVHSLSEQRHIVDTIGSVDDLIEFNEQKILKLESILIDKFNDFYKTKCNNIDKLGNVFNCLLGGTPNTSKPEFWGGNINWINSGEVNNLRICKPSKKITELGMNKSATKLLPKGTIVLAITGATLGQISLLEIDTCANQSVVGILENNTFGKEFIYPLVNYHIKDLISHQTGGAQPHINKDNIENLSIKLPTADDYINYKNETRLLVELQSNLVIQNEKLKNIKECLLKKYFG